MTDSQTYLNASDDKLMPSLETFNQLTQQAEECRKLAIERKTPLTYSEQKSAYRFVRNCLMYNIFGDLWITGDATDPNYDVMCAFYKSIKTAMKMHADRIYSNAEDFEKDLNCMICTHRNRYTSATAYSAYTTYKSWMVSLLPIVAFAVNVLPAAPIVLSTVLLVNEIGFIPTIDIIAKATKLGLKVGSVSVRSVAWIINVVDKLL